MGFGLLFIGYALAFAFNISVSSVGVSQTSTAIPYFFSDVIGGLLMTYAFSKLSAYDKKFRLAFFASLSYSIISLVIAVDRFITNYLNSVALTGAKALLAVSIIFLHFSLFSAVISISRSVGLLKITLKARRNLIVMIVYFTLYTLTLLSHKTLEASYPDSVKYVYLFFIIFQFVWLFMNLILIGSCLKRIGEEGEGAVDPKPSRIKKLYSLWSEKEDKIYTPKERRSDSNKKK